ncbi:conserved hypothetical protein (plasmid) [Ralstonia solanacearum Po82]|uniref:Uncharacterized protein n=1 Tax=Ralstonia solanacearum (strain Po82) TaxID=1031711 RepID=F6G844_RALS8|nr:conserved hypothetical protein [Ralstonia solanacearum Po82]
MRVECWHCSRSPRTALWKKVHVLLSALKKLRSKSLREKPAINELVSSANLEKEIASWRKR